jgi:hypothetical protein
VGKMRTEVKHVRERGPLRTAIGGTSDQTRDDTLAWPGFRCGVFVQLPGISGCPSQPIVWQRHWGKADGCDEGLLG